MLRSGLIAPYRGVRHYLKEYSPTNPPENPLELFNLRHSSLRNAIERVFGVLKKRFPIIGSTAEPTYSMNTQSEVVLACCILHNYLMGVDPDESLIEEVDREILNESQGDEEGRGHMEEDEDAEWAGFLRDTLAGEMWRNFYVTS